MSTPLEQQVIRLKAQHPQLLLAVQCGYRYRFFADDAVIAAKALDINLTTPHTLQHASIPLHRLQVHLPRLVHAAGQVGVVNQVETNRRNVHSSFTRKLSHVYTTANLQYFMSTGDSHLESETILIVYRHHHSIVIVLMDIYLCTLHWESFEHISLCQLSIHVGRYLETHRPLEILLVGAISKAIQDTIQRIQQFHSRWHFIIRTIPSLQNACMNLPIPQLHDPALRNLVISVFPYLDQIGLSEIVLNTKKYHHIKSDAACLHLNDALLRNLNVFSPTQDSSLKKQFSSLFDFLNRASSSAGKRLLKKWIREPLASKVEIDHRLDAVEFLSNIPSRKKNFVPILKKMLTHIPDFHLLTSKIITGNSSEKDMILLHKGLLRIDDMLTQLRIQFDFNKLPSLLLKHIFIGLCSFFSSSMWERLSALLGNINEEYSSGNTTGQSIFTDYSSHESIQQCLHQIGLTELNLEHDLQKASKVVRIPLKYKKFLSLEYVVEIPLDMLNHIPANWIPLGGTKYCARYRSPGMTESYSELTLLRDNLQTLNNEAWNIFIQQFQRAGNLHHLVEEIQLQADLLAQLDCLISLAEVARCAGYCRPIFVGSSTSATTIVELRDIRHPLIENLLPPQQPYVPNDIQLDSSNLKALIVTGPNMGGKSCLIRSVGLVCLMAHIGSFVPTSSARMSVLSGIYCRIGGSEDWGGSTFFTEATETSEILVGGIRKGSLVLLDELGRGTSTHDGEAIAWASLYYLIAEGKGCIVFSTHFLQIPKQLSCHFPKEVIVMYLSYAIDGCHRIVCLYRLVDGVCPSSFGFSVALQAGIPAIVVSTAMLKSLQNHARTS